MVMDEAASLTPPRVDFVLGGARSGKSRLALARAEATRLAPLHLATAAAYDDEMADRIARHKAERGPHWGSVEEQLDLVAALGHTIAPERVVVVDCLTLWLSNLIFAARDIETEIARLVEALPELSGPVILVSNEVGLGIVPENALARAFRDHQGRLNQRVAAVADRVTFVAAGLPLVLKDERPRI